MKDFIKNKETSDILFHQFMKCMHLMRSSMHRGRDTEFGPHGHFGHNHFHHGRMEKGNRGGFRGPDMYKIGQGRLLSILLEKDGINQKELSDLLRISAASVSELVNKLATGGYIERKQNEDDKRVTNIFLTEGGRFFAQKMQEGRLQISRDIFSALDEEEQKQLLDLISKLIDSLSENNDDTDFENPFCRFRDNRFSEDDE